MRSFPLPVRVAAGLASTAAEQTRRLPGYLIGLPITVTSQVLQVSMQLQQQVTQLAIKGDELLTGQPEPEEHPGWATFDEDEQDPLSDSAEQTGEDEPRAEAPHKHERTDGPPATGETSTGNVAVLSDYDQLSLPQLRGKLRKLSEDQLAALLEHEHAHGRRPEFLRMLTNRLETLRSAENRR